MLAIVINILQHFKKIKNLSKPVNILRTNDMVIYFENVLLRSHRSSSLLKQNGLLDLDTLNENDNNFIFGRLAS